MSSIIQKMFQRYLLPGLVFQGVVIGGGYATGRELVEFFFSHGPVGGLLAMGVTALVWSCVMALSFELCRITKSYDYKTFFYQLLGPAWFLYEWLFMALMVVVLSVLGAAAGQIVQELFNVPPLTGSLGLLLAIGILAFYGSQLIERFMGFWSVLLYLSYLGLVIGSFVVFGEDIKTNFNTVENTGGWAMDGIRYAGYNLATVPAVFFCLNHITRRKEALTAGALAGVIGIFPAIFLFVAMMGKYPEIGEATVPSMMLLEQIDSPIFSLVFQLILLGTLVQTGVGLVHTINERVASSLAEKGRTMPGLLRSAVAAVVLLAAFFLATRFGLVNLIAKGYGFLTYGFIAVFVIPVLTIGAYKIFKPTKDKHQTNAINIGVAYGKPKK